jgi:hypothetical protein
VRFIQDADTYANGVVQQRPIWRKPDQIVKIQLQRVIDRLAKQNIHLTVTDDTTRYLADAGFDPVFGARPLKRAVQKAPPRSAELGGPRRRLQRRRSHHCGDEEREAGV